MYTFFYGNDLENPIKMINFTRNAVVLEKLSHKGKKASHPKILWAS